MAVRAFVLFEVAGGKTREVVDGLKRIEGIKSVDPVTGPYDVIAIVEAETMNDIGDLVTGKIHPIPGVSRTVTCLTIRAA